MSDWRRKGEQGERGRRTPSVLFMRPLSFLPGNCGNLFQGKRALSRL